MGVVAKLVVVLLAVGLYYSWSCVTNVPPIPKLERTWWGPGKPTKVDESIRPIKISIPEKTLVDLNRRLESHSILRAPLEGINFEYGFNTNYLKTVIEFWRKEYKWRERETFLNSVPHFKTRVSGLDIHYIHVKPKQVPEGVRVIPAMLLHGWPGSVREFYEMIPMMTTPRKGVDFVFEVVVPSLPGYGFSEGASKPGLGAGEMAVVLHNLMERVGLPKYFIHGGDWGSMIARNIAILYPEDIIGLHINMCVINSVLTHLKTFIGSIYPPFVVSADKAHLMYPLTNKFHTLLEESGYMHIQATKPDTVGVGLSDSPVGLAAYIMEKFSSWTDPAWKHLPDGGLTKKFTLTDILDNVMIYWVTGSITTSVRMYSETLSKAQTAHGFDQIPVLVPSACAVFPNDLLYQSEFIVKEKFPNMVRFTDMDRGGHFAAFEEPTLMADDIWATVQAIENKNKTAKT